MEVNDERIKVHVRFDSDDRKQIVEHLKQKYHYIDSLEAIIGDATRFIYSKMPIDITNNIKQHRMREQAYILSTHQGL